MDNYIKTLLPKLDEHSTITIHLGKRSDGQILDTNISEKGYLKTLFSKDVIKKRRLGLNKKHTICETCDLGNADYMGYQETIDQEVVF